MNIVGGTPLPENSVRDRGREHFPGHLTLTCQTSSGLNQRPPVNSSPSASVRGGSVFGSGSPSVLLIAPCLDQSCATTLHLTRQQDRPLDAVLQHTVLPPTALFIRELPFTFCHLTYDRDIECPIARTARPPRVGLFIPFFSTLLALVLISRSRPEPREQDPSQATHRTMDGSQGLNPDGSYAGTPLPSASSLMVC